MLVMPTRRFLPGTPCFLGSCAIYIHFSVPMTPLCYLEAMAGGAPPPPRPPRLNLHFYCFDIGSREPNYAVFQQNPIVVTAEIDAPMDPDAITSQAWRSVHCTKGFFSVFRDSTALRRNPIRSAPESQIMLFFSKIRSLHRHSSTLRWTQTL